MSARRTPSGLAARIVRLALMVGAITIAAAGGVSMYTVSNLTHQKAQTQARHVAEVAEDGIEQRLLDVSMAVDQSGAGLSGSSAVSRETSLATIVEARSANLAKMMIADTRGIVLASAPGTSSAGTNIKRLPIFRAALLGHSGYLVVSGKRSWELWTCRPVVGGDGRLLFVIGRVAPGFISQVLESSIGESPDLSVLLLDNKRVVAHGGVSIQPNLGSLRWDTGGAGSGTVRLTASGAGMTGDYRIVGASQNLNWRIVVVGREADQARDAMIAVAPLIAVLLFGGTVALLLAWGMARRLAQPLRELERAAHNAALGSYVRPLNSSRDDELGRVAGAFNAVALRLNALQDVSQLLASASRLDQVLDGILAAMGHLVGPGAAAIFLLDEEKRWFVPVRTRGRELANARPVDALATGWLNTALATQDPVVLQGGEGQLEIELPGFVGRGANAIAAPLIAGMEPLGVVVIVRGTDAALAEGEREMVRTFSAQAAVAVQTSRLFETESESRRISEALRRVAEQLVGPGSLARALETVEKTVEELFLARGAAIVVVDREVVGLAPSPASEHETALLSAAYRVLGPAGDVGVGVIDRGQDAACDEVLDRLGAEHLMVVPIALETDHGAVLAIAVDDWELGSRALEIGKSLGDEIALALDNAYFYQRALRRAGNLETIFRISQAVGSSLQVNVVLNRVLDVVQKILSADAVVLMSYDDRRKFLTPTMGRGALPNSVMQLQIEPGEDLPGHVFERGEPVAMRDLHPGGEGLAGLAAASNLRSLLAVPLRARGRSLGVLIVFSTEAGAFSDEDVNVLQTFASQAALAIDTARLYSQEHEISSVLQHSILPEELPDYPEIETGTVYSPAGDDSEIGGDYYDVFRGRDGRLWFAIADVCGKGVRAATKTSMIKYVVRALVVAGKSPAEIVSEANDMIAEAGNPSDIVTLWLGVYDPKAGTLEWADGGHPPGRLLRADGTTEVLGVTGPLLGAMRGAPYEEQQVCFLPGDCFLLFTDGITEARHGNTFFGEDRAVSVLKAGGSPQLIADSLLHQVQMFAEGRVRDDIAILAVRARDVGSARSERGPEGAHGTV